MGKTNRQDHKGGSSEATPRKKKNHQLKPAKSDKYKVDISAPFDDDDEPKHRK